MVAAPVRGAPCGVVVVSTTDPENRRREVTTGMIERYRSSIGSDTAHHSRWDDANIDDDDDIDDDYNDYDDDNDDATTTTTTQLTR
jgi:hypothetical protein